MLFLRYVWKSFMRCIYRRCTWWTIRGYQEYPHEWVSIPANVYLPAFPPLRFWSIGKTDLGTGKSIRLLEWLSAVTPRGMKPYAGFYPTFGEAGIPHYQPTLEIGILPSTKNPGMWILSVVLTLGYRGRWVLRVPGRLSLLPKTILRWEPWELADGRPVGEIEELAIELERLEAEREEQRRTEEST